MKQALGVSVSCAPRVFAVHLFENIINSLPPGPGPDTRGTGTHTRRAGAAARAKRHTRQSHTRPSTVEEVEAGRAAPHAKNTERVLDLSFGALSLLSFYLTPRPTPRRRALPGGAGGASR